MKKIFNEPLVTVPVLQCVDVIIVGASSGAVAAALSCRESGARPFVISDRSYFGEESAGALRLWQEAGAGWSDLLFESGREATVFPGRIKHALENALLKVEIPFLFLTRPVAVLRDENDGVAGVLVAYRTALYAILGGQLIDASLHGALARLAGVKGVPRVASSSETAELTLLAESCPDSWTEQAKPVGISIRLPSRAMPNNPPPPGTPSNGETTDLHAFKLALPNPSHDGSIAALAAREHRLRAGVADCRFRHSADHVRFPAFHSVSASLKSNPAQLENDDFLAGPGLFLLNELLPLDGRGLGALEGLQGQFELGGRVGRLAAAAAASAPTPGRPVRAGVDGGEGEGDYRFASSFVRQAESNLEITLPEFPLLASVDVLVAGGGTGGAPAGISAARAGAKTVVLEVQHGLGGVGTLGLIASYYFGNKVGFTAEIERHMRRLDPQRYVKPTKRWNPELKMALYGQLLADAGGEAWFGSFVFGVKTCHGKIQELLVSTPYGAGRIRCGCTVDATGNADVAAAAGAPCRVIDARHVAVQGAGLSPRNPAADGQNSDHNFIDDSDPSGVTHAFVKARAKFGDAFDVSPMIDTRERRQIIGEIEVSPLDILAGRTFPDTITTAESNFDTHGFTIHPVFMTVPPDKKALRAHVPFRALLPKGIEGLLVTGLGLSAHRDAIPVIRMQADVQNQGYAAGLAAALSAAGHLPLRNLEMRQLQERLRDHEILEADVPTHQDSFPLSAQIVRQAVEDGPRDLFQTAVLFAHATQSIPMLMEKLASATDQEVREETALVLGMLGEPTGAEVLAEAVAAREWDDGWNYRGMGQFGMSMSRLDALIIALGRTGSPLAVTPLVEKIEALGSEAFLSHCRAVAVAAAGVADARLAEALAGLLAKAGLQGHAQTDLRQTVHQAIPDLNETEARNLSLRELHLARGLYLCGDKDGLGRRILEAYACDLRGPYARHAQALLEVDDIEAIRRQTV